MLSKVVNVYSLDVSKLNNVRINENVEAIKSKLILQGKNIKDVNNTIPIKSFIMDELQSKEGIFTEINIDGVILDFLFFRTYAGNCYRYTRLSWHNFENINSNLLYQMYLDYENNLVWVMDDWILREVEEARVRYIVNYNGVNVCRNAIIEFEQ